MSIQSTKEVTREWAIQRIEMIYNIIRNRHYMDLFNESYEPKYDLRIFIDEFIHFDIINIGRWTNNMLGDKLDEPFFRESIYDNYIVGLQ